jgi:hypothetical protein
MIEIPVAAFVFLLVAGAVLSVLAFDLVRYVVRVNGENKRSMRRREEDLRYAQDLVNTRIHEIHDILTNDKKSL